MSNVTSLRLVQVQFYMIYLKELRVVSCLSFYLVEVDMELLQYILERVISTVI